MRSLLAVAIAVLTACSLTTDLEGFTSSDGGQDGSTLDASGDDDVLVPDDDSGASKGEVVIATNASDYAAGAAQQHHVHFAQNLGAYVVFYLSANEKESVKTRLTSDFVTFTDGPSIPLPRPHDGDGRNLDVAYASLAGADVFHLVISIHGGGYYSYRARLRLKDGATAIDETTELGHAQSAVTTLDPDGPAIAIAAGRVVISSGYNALKEEHIGNTVTFVASTIDDGAESWDHSFASGVELETAQDVVNARALVVYPGGASLVWERGDGEPRPKSLARALFDGTKWTPASRLGFSSAAFDVADWSEVATSDGRVHVVRFANGGYEHRYLIDAENGGFPIPALVPAEGDGLVLLARDASPIAVALSKDRALKRSILDGTTWSAWTDVAPADDARRHLSGNADVILWQRGPDLVGLRLSQ